MGLSKKTFLYSMIISFILMVFVILYFSQMLPSLYVAYMEKDNLEAVVNVQKGYMQKRSYEGLLVKNPTGSLTVELPYVGSTVYLTGMNFQITAELKDSYLKDTIIQLRDTFRSAQELDEVDKPEIDIQRLKEELIPKTLQEASYPLTLHAEMDQDESQYKEKPFKTHVISDSIMVFEGGVYDGNNEYTSYVAVGKTSDAIIISFLPVMTPQMKEIEAIVLQSLPMLTAVIFLLVLIASQLFSKKIVNPVIRLAGYAQEMKWDDRQQIPPLPIKEKDEIGQLGRILNELYSRLQVQYQELEDKNQALKLENKRQEVFLRASSHQLKTPITAALLLVEGMLNEVGKYKDTKKYLPEVKKQLQSMRKIVEDILYLNHCAEHLEKERTDIPQVVREVLETHKIQASYKNLAVTCDFEIPLIWNTDREFVKKIVDNLISNAAAYTPAGNRIHISTDGTMLDIFNEGASIEEKLLPHIYEPFVSSDTVQKGRGLGLYVASYYGELLGLKVEVTNKDQGVLARVSPKELLTECTETSFHLHTGLL